MFGLARIGIFLANYGHIIAVAAFIAFAAWWVYDAGVDAERAKWEAAQQEKTDALRKELAKANEESRAAEARILDVSRQRDQILMDYQAAIADDDLRECIGPDRLRDFNATIERLRPLTPGTVN